MGEVKLAPDCIGDDVTAMVDGMDDGSLIILENTRFYKEETKNEPEFVEKLAKPFDMFVLDAFGTAHRAHASTEGVTKFLKPSVSGFLLAKELEFLDGAISSGEKPLAAIVGGSKDFIETAKGAMKLAEENNCELILPSDIVIADKFAADAESKICKATEIPDGWMGLDNGPEATADIVKALADCKTVVWNGPMGVFEFDAFGAGTKGVAEALADITGKGACTIIGG